jgi:hypothetical protein
MLKLFERLPDSITVDGKRYRCNFDFRNVLKMLDIMQRDDILPDARDYLCSRCVCNAPKNAAKVYNELCAVLFPKPAETGTKRLTSYEQDAGMIRAAFRQVYGIDLFRAHLHWLEFVELLQYLPEGCRYEETIDIRARPMPAPTKYNAKEREWLMKAKQSVALHLPEKEQARKYEQDVSNVFAGIMGMIRKAQAAEQADAKEVGTDGK